MRWLARRAAHILAAVAQEPIPGLPESLRWERRWRASSIAPLLLLPVALGVVTALTTWFALRGERGFAMIALASFVGFALSVAVIVILARRALPLRRALDERPNDVVWVFVERTLSRSGLRKTWCVYVGTVEGRIHGLEAPTEADATRAEAALASLVPHATRGLTPELRARFFGGDPASLRKDRRA